MAKTYMLRTCAPDGTSYDGFQWPRSGRVTAPDWNPAPECGGGLHGLLIGEGDGGLLNWDPDAVWIVAEIDADAVVDLDRKIKAPYADVVYYGPRAGALVDIVSRGADPSRIVGGTVTAGDYGRATAGAYGTATAGDGGTATAGRRGTATAGDSGSATAGRYGTATAGEGGSATAGEGGTATAGRNGSATAGEGGSAMAGRDGSATAGEGGRIAIAWYDGRRERVVIGYVGEDGIIPNTPYRVQNGRLVPA